MASTVLVAVDGSEASFKALDVATDLTGEHLRTLILLHVVPVGELPPGLRRWASVEHAEKNIEWFYERNVADGLLETAARRIGAKGDLEIRKRVEHGDPAEQILKVANEDDVDTIVVGTRGLGEFKGNLMGSVAQKVNHSASCTVITVK